MEKRFSEKYATRWDALADEEFVHTDIYVGCRGCLFSNGVIDRYYCQFYPKGKPDDRCDENKPCPYKQER